MNAQAIMLFDQIIGVVGYLIRSVLPGFLCSTPFSSPLGSRVSLTNQPRRLIMFGLVKWRVLATGDSISVFGVKFVWFIQLTENNNKALFYLVRRERSILIISLKYLYDKTEIPTVQKLYEETYKDTYLPKLLIQRLSHSLALIKSEHPKGSIWLFRVVLRYHFPATKFILILDQIGQHYSSNTLIRSFTKSTIHSQTFKFFDDSHYLRFILCIRFPILAHISRKDFHVNWTHIIFKIIDLCKFKGNFNIFVDYFFVKFYFLKGLNIRNFIVNLMVI